MRHGSRLAEFDTPGHVQVGYAAIPDLLTTCYNGSEAYGTALNPTLDSTYEFLTNLFAEVKTLFPDQFVHVV